MSIRNLNFHGKAKVVQYNVLSVPLNSFLTNKTTQEDRTDSKAKAKFEWVKRSPSVCVITLYAQVLSVVYQSTIQTDLMIQRGASFLTITYHPIGHLE